MKGYNLIKLLDRINSKAQYVNIMSDLGGLDKIIAKINKYI